MPALKLFFLQMAVVLVAARIMGALSRRVGQPQVAGEMIAGILLGPSVLGRLFPAAMYFLFPAAGLGPLDSISQLGLVLFLFLIGLDVRGAAPVSAKWVAIASAVSIAVPFACGGALAWGLYGRLGSGASAFDPSRLSFVLFLGAAMSITAFPVLARILKDRGLMNSRAGVFAISCAVVDDVVAWCLLAAITVIAQPQAHMKAVVFRFAGLGIYVAAMLFAIRPLLRRLFPPGSRPGAGWFGAAMIFLLCSVSVTEALGVHALFGAFLSGVAMPGSEKLESEFRVRLEPVTLALFLPLFFAYTGLRTSLGLLGGAGDWVLCGLILAVAVLSKMAPSATCARMSGMPWRESLAVGALVNTRGLVGLIILNAGLDLGILSPALFSMMVIVAVITTLMAGPMVGRLLPGAGAREHAGQRVRAAGFAQSA